MSKTKSIKLSPLRIPAKVAEEFPSEAPILGPKDMWYGTYANDVGSKCCLLGHINKWLSGNPEQDSVLFSLEDFPCKALQKASGFILGKEACKEIGYEIEVVNDILCETLQHDLRTTPNVLRSRIWNLAMALLGYSVGNPEAKYVKSC